MNTEDNQNRDKSPGPLDVLKSVGAAMFGVQSEAARERDFKKGKASHFIIAGVIFVIVFLLTIYSVVSSVITP